MEKIQKKKIFLGNPIFSKNERLGRHREECFQKVKKLSFDIDFLLFFTDHFCRRMKVWRAISAEIGSGQEQLEKNMSLLIVG